VDYNLSIFADRLEDTSLPLVNYYLPDSKHTSTSLNGKSFVHH
jgi:hypothetical protein